MSKMEKTAKKVIALAYLHRYGWIAVMMVCILIWNEQTSCILCLGCFCFSIWSFVGYKRKWKHIFCSYQNAYHQKMTPDLIRWQQIKKSDAYGIPLLFLFLGLAMLILVIVN